jgi:NAD(P)-dependent dehydrogenase (short-subunit alcohol dehydrogenase family)
MARVLVTGSADGLGRAAAALLVEAGHRVVVHGRSAERAGAALEQIPGAEAAVAGDLASIDATCRLAEEVNQLGTFDAVIHNAGIGYRERRRCNTRDGLPEVLAVNTVAPYILTALITRPQRLIYISSQLHRSADTGLQDLTWTQRPWNGLAAYAETKLHEVLLAFAVARHWPKVLANSVEPGWVATKMGGPNAPDDLDAAPRTQVWLATSNDAAARVSGRHFYHMQERKADPAASDPELQDRLLAECARITGIPFPASSISRGRTEA